ncbi:hypothetical protein PR048_004311 [Dryococelus australis]|uniref:Serine carboxypeptidase n=1 Tax=Dryococelus australis TaxID=614101 RepID=A0ABQ9I703_9NEOP|nr:hypothetical protein PR048_004311 [Dryococelus australis]
MPGHFGKFLDQVGRKGLVESQSPLVTNELLFAYENFSGMFQLENFIVRDTPRWNSDAKHAHFVQRSDVRRAIHVGDHAAMLDLSIRVYDALVPDQMRSVKRWLEDLLNVGYRVICFSGQLDVIVGYPLSIRMYLSLKFSASEEYRRVKRIGWYTDNELAGYTKTAGNFTEVMVRGAGHMVPLDQPRRTLAFVNAVIRETNNKH